MRNKVDHVNHMGSADEVLEAIHAVMHVFRARQYRMLGGAAQQTTHLEGKLLGLIGRRPGMTQSELAGLLERDKGQLARLLGGLKDRGLVETRADEQDRRAQRLHLSEQGEQQRATLEGERKRLAATATSGLSAEERRQLLQMLQRIRAQLDTAP